MEEYSKNQEISTHTLNFTSKILENIINFHSSLDEIDKPIKKQENCVAFPFSISLESSKSSSKFQNSYTNVYKKRQNLVKNNTCILRNSLQSTATDMGYLFFKTTDDIQCSDDITKKMLHQMEHDINYSKLLQKEEHNEEITSTNNSEHPKQTIEEKINGSLENDNQKNNDSIDEDRKMFGSIENFDKKIMESMDNDDKEILELLTNGCAKQEKNEKFQKRDIDDEEIPEEVKAFKNIQGLAPSQQKSRFADLDNSNITYIEEPSFFKFGEKNNKLNLIFDKNIVREGWMLRKTRNLISGWEVSLLFFIFYF